MELRYYQQDLVNKINESTNKRNCVQLPTGGGKTVIFSHLANEHKGKVLILVNRKELLEQTEVKIKDYCALITAGTKEIEESKVTIGMVESVYNRQKKGAIDINSFDLIIVDEIQNLQFVKVFEGYKNRLLGFTATPVIDKRDFYFKCKYCGSKSPIKTTCCGKETKEYSKSYTLKKYYGDLITGVTISELIDNGFLTQVHNFVCDTEGMDKLKTDKSGQFTSKSESEVFDNYASLDNLVLNYKEHCKGLKTMVFNSSIASNEMAYQKFLELGYNVRSYDSKSDEDRAEIVEWFRNTPDGILMSVGVFTTGFDVDDVEAIIMNKATNSLSLYHQIVGRGGRITNKIYKPFFKFIDLGGNVSRFGSWSDDVDWNRIYYSENEKQRRVNDLEDFKTCHSCGAMILEYDCEYCGATKKKDTPKAQTSEKVIAQEMTKLPKPKAVHILNYAKANNLSLNEAKNLVANYILDMFIFSKTSKESVLKNGRYIENEILKIIRPIYFELHRSDLDGVRRKTIRDFFCKVTARLKKHYGIERGKNTTGNSCLLSE
jgi:superfamily II DNA or RNA helicase